MKIENVEKAGWILTKHLKNNKNILILGEGYSTGKTTLFNKIMENSENKEKIFNSYWENKKLNGYRRQRRARKS